MPPQRRVMSAVVALKCPSNGTPEIRLLQEMIIHLVYCAPIYDTVVCTVCCYVKHKLFDLP